MNVDVMLEQVSGIQFEEWKQFFRIKNWEFEQESKKARR